MWSVRNDHAAGHWELAEGGKVHFKQPKIPTVVKANASSRFANMDYIAALVIYACAMSLILFSYNIACQWFINLFCCVDEHWPAALKIPSTKKLIPAIPKLHEPMHGGKNHHAIDRLRATGVSQTRWMVQWWKSGNRCALYGRSANTQRRVRTPT